MKINKLFMGLAAMAFVGCSSDDLNVIAPEQAVEDARLVELDPNFVIAGVGAEASGTRTHWEQDATTKALVNKFLPIWNTAPAGGNKIYDGGITSTDADLEAQAVGLCWLGQGAVGTDVYTNYQFYHFGWLNNDETKANFECGELTNGSKYDEITVAAGDAAGDEADETLFTLPSKSATAGLNYNSGVYKTDNKSIFGGQYIVYYPFNEDFKDAGTIPAIAETTFGNPAMGTGVSTSFDTPELGKATFRYSSPVTIEGGSQASDFGLYNLSSLVQLRVACPTGDAAIGKFIDQIVLVSKSKKLLKQANLAADKIAAGQKGADLYASTEGTKTIVANFATAPALDATDGAVTSAYITVLPTTVEDLVVLVHRTDGKWATVEKANTVFEAGKAKRLDISVKDDDFTDDFIAVDEASLLTALVDANAVATPATPATITVIGDITLTADPSIIPATYSNCGDITIKGDDIIVPQDVTLTLNTNMASNVRVLGKSCCTGLAGGILDIQGGTVNNVTMEPTEAKVTAATYDTYNPTVIYSAAATIAAGKTFDVQAGNVVVNDAVAHKGDIKIAKGAKLTVNAGGDLNFMGSTVVNDGTIEVMKNGKYDMTDSDGNATATDGKRMTNNGKFIHNVDAGVGTAVQSMQQNGEYRCKVDEQIKLDDAYLQWTACSVIEMVNASAETYNLGTGKGVAYKHNNKYIDIEVNTGIGSGATFNNPGTTNGDNENIQTGNLTVTTGTLVINFVKGTGKRSLTVNGNMAVKGNTDIISSKKIDVKKNLTVTGATLTYKGKKANVDGLAVTKDIKVSGAAGQFIAGTGTDVDALNITCANFYLEKKAKATFGNRTDGAAKNLVVSGTISNPAGCTFDIEAANQDGAGSVLAWVTCTNLEVGGTFSAARPRVVE